MRPLRILILGGTQFIGIHMVEAARQRGHAVTLFNRGRCDPKRFRDVEQLKGDRDGQLDALKGRKWDAVIDNCGYVPRHVRLSAELLAPNVRHYLFISTVAVYADFSRPNDETSPLATIDDETREDWQKAYGPLKVLCERAAEAAMPGRTTMVRPGLVAGPHDWTDRFTYWAARATRGGAMLAAGNPQSSYQFIDARDLAMFCIEVLEKRTLGVFNVVSPAGHFRKGDVVNEAIAAARAVTKPASPPEAVWVSDAFVSGQNLQSCFDGLFWYPDRGPKAGWNRMRVERAIAAGLIISPLSKTTRDTLAWHLARPEAERVTLQAGVPAELEREALARWRAYKT